MPLDNTIQVSHEHVKRPEQCHYCSTFSSLTRQRPIYIFDIILVFQKTYGLSTLIFRGSQLPQIPKFDILKEKLKLKGKFSDNHKIICSLLHILGQF